VPIVSAFDKALVITGILAESPVIVRASVSVVAALALDAEIFTSEVPAAIGVPVIAPVVTLIDNPDGNPVALNDEAAPPTVI
jgi:hypothetical protein